MPVVRAMADWHAMQISGQQGLAGAMDPPGNRIGEDLGVWLALDRPNSLSHLKPSTLVLLGGRFCHRIRRSRREFARPYRSSVRAAG